MFQMRRNRFNNVIKNLSVGLIAQVIAYILSFVTRTTLIYSFAQEYIGISSLFSNFILIFSIAESGAGSAFESLLYKSLDNGDDKTTNFLFFKMKKTFLIISLVVFFIGGTIYPFWNYIIGNTEIKLIGLIYFMIVARTAAVYMLTCYQSIISADQKQYVYTFYSKLWAIIQYALQIIAILIFNNFILYILIQEICGVMIYVCLRHYAKRNYPCIRKNERGIKNRSLNIEVGIRIRAGFFVHLGYIITSGSDSIFITKLLGLAVLGIYSNYLLIIQMINTFLSIMFSSLTASIGNLIVSESREKVYNNFKVVYFIGIISVGFTSICLVNLFNPFINFWLGKEYLFPEVTVLLLVVANALGEYGIKKVVTIYKVASGLYVKDKFLYIVEAFAKMIITLVLIKIIGINGVFVGGILSGAITFVSGVYILYKYLFHERISDFLIRNIKYVFSLISIDIIVFISIKGLCFSNTFLGFAMRLATCVLEVLLLFVLFFHKDEAYKWLLSVVANNLKKIKRK